MITGEIDQIHKSKIKSSQIKKNPRSHDQIITSPTLSQTRKNWIDRLPTESRAYLHPISGWVIGRVGICRNSVYIQLNLELQSYVPEYAYQLAQIFTG